MNRPDLVRKVISYYEKHGRRATEDAFPSVNVRSITDRPGFYGVKMRPRQKRWTEAEIIQATRMAGIVDGKTQAKIFKRPGAREGSIKSLWMKRFGHGGGSIHGMSEWMAKQILRPGYPVLKTRVWSPRRASEESRGPKRGIVLWAVMAPYLKDDVPSFIRRAVHSMANFQVWLFAPKDPVSEIHRLAKMRAVQ